MKLELFEIEVDGKKLKVNAEQKAKFEAEAKKAPVKKEEPKKEQPKKPATKKIDLNDKE